MAPKTRAYTKEELQGLRRADLQRLCKVHDIKGANAKSDALIDILVDFFNSPAYLTSPKAGTSRVRTGPKSTGDRTGHAVLARPPRPKLPPASAVAHSSLKRRVDAPSSVRGPTTQSQSVAQPPVDTRLNDAAGTSANVATAPKDLSSGEQRPSAHTGAPSAPPTAPTVEAQTVAATTAQASGANEAGVESAVRSDLALLQRSVAALEHQQSDQVFETRVKGILNTTLQQHIVLIEEREAALQRREKALDEAWSRLERAMASHFTDDPRPQDSDPDQLRSKRKGRESSIDFGPESKRVRRGDGDTSAGNNSGSEDMGTQPPPRTPSPSLTAMEAAQELMAQPPAFSSFANGPKEGQSPTSGRAPPRNGPPPIPYGRVGPGGVRPHHDRSRRKVSQAHIDLSTITESRTTVSDSGPDGPYLGPIVVHKRAVSPPALSPSPSIGGDNFTYTPHLPQPPRNTQRPSSEAASSSAAAARSGFSPGREYMDVALNGIWDPEASPSAHATPSSRTMIGTERFRDRRFADEVELVPWATPKVDFGHRPSSH